jgi:hypothetical protein
VALRGDSCSCFTKTRCAVSGYFQGEWNLLDFLNYTLLIVAVAMRWWGYLIMAEKREAVAALPRNGCRRRRASPLTAAPPPSPFARRCR